MTLHARSTGLIFWVSFLACSAGDGDGDGDGDASSTDDDDSGSADSTPSTSDGSSLTAATASSDTSADSGSASASSDSGGDTGTPSMACTAAADCVLVDDCCTCGAFHIDDAPGTCDMDCEQSSCSALGLDDISATCTFGHCEIADVSCNPVTVACDAKPPTCQKGSVPRVVDGCWGSCVPAEICDVVPTCASCPADETCVEHSLGFAGSKYTCEPIAPECDDTPTCACMPGVCDLGANHCIDGEGSISCE